MFQDKKVAPQHYLYFYQRSDQNINPTNKPALALTSSVWLLSSIDQDSKTRDQTNTKFTKKR